MGFVVSLVVAVAAAFFLQALLEPAQMKRRESFEHLKKELRAMQASTPTVAPSKSDVFLRRHLDAVKASPRASNPVHASPQSEVRAAFCPLGDAAAMASLRVNGKHLTHVLIDALHVTKADGTIEQTEDPDEGIPTPDAGFQVLAMLSNDIDGVRIPEGVENLASAPLEVRQQFIRSIADALRKYQAAGVVIDWTEIDPGLRDDLTGLVAEVAKSLKAQGFQTWLCVEMDNDFDCFDLNTLGPVVDRFLARLEDENGGSESPGPVASQDWFDGWIQVASGYGRPEQWVVAVGTFGYDWASDAKDPEQISFADVMSRADNAGIASLKVGAPFFNGDYSYFERETEHTVWFTDAATFANGHGALRDAGFAGFALYRLGSEDPGVWKLIKADAEGRDLRTVLPELGTVKLETGIPSVGRGEIVGLDATESEGKRTLSLTEDDRVTADYSSFGSLPTLFRTGDGGPRKVAITFDDGPDPVWTPRILKILASRGVKATFFMIGREMEENSDLVSRVLKEGHEIGNHSFTHPNLAKVPDARIALELNATQRLLESITGRSTSLFRPPYNADSRPTDPAELRAIRVAQELGYTTVLENIDPRDWQQPGARELLRRVKDARPEGNILLLHDGGGNRQQTVEALPAIIDYLHERGDEIVTVSELMGMSRDDVMPKPAGEKAVNAVASQVGFLSWHVWMDFMRTFLLIATVLVVLRTVLVLILASVHMRRPEPKADYAPAVSVIIPAYNEEKVITQTVRSILAFDHKGEMEVLVIDDGSTDATSARVREINDPRVRLFTIPNGGKAHALQYGTERAKHEFLVFLDGDTQFDRAAVRELLAGFRDPKLGAVSGHARVGNTRKFLAKCQDLEYVCGFNLDRRAYDVWNCITVVPGAISAFRASAIREAGGFSFDTLAEDTDLTLAIHRSGYRIGYRRAAVAYTEAPETFRALAKQRFRWAYGTLQCVWKHRDMLFNPRFKALGFFSLPGIWFFQVVLVAFSPIIDLMFLQSLLIGTAMAILPYFAVFLAADLLLAAAAVRMEPMPLRSALIVIPQRFVYRPLLSYVIWKSIVHALRGAWVGWGKLQRTANVSLPCDTSSSH